MRIDQSPIWKKLKLQAAKMKKIHMRQLFALEKERGQNFSISFDDFYLDYSKNRCDAETMAMLFELPGLANLESEIERMARGEKINGTENRPVLHQALRNLSGTPVYVDNRDIMPDIFACLERMKTISRQIRHGQWYGYGHQPIEYIVNIGIGGSNLGPKMACQALNDYKSCRQKLFFLANVDGIVLASLLKEIELEKSLFIISSKSFTTPETLINAASIKKILLSKFGNSKALNSHFIAVTAHKEKAESFGLAEENILPLWDWVGGRYSMTSAIGLPIMIAIGYEHYMEMLQGFQTMDNHFHHSPPRENIPIILALLGIWYNNFWQADSLAILPYIEHLRYFPSYLQQLDMESNGKGVNRQGKKVTYQTGPIIWGDVGTTCQHSFFQLMHQGSKLIPADFIGFSQIKEVDQNHHHQLMANFFAQTAALAFGQTKEELKKSPIPSRLIPFKIFDGNRPSNTLLIRELTPRNLGMLIALYEHKVFSQGIIWNIFSFDQWGVELGKRLAGQFEPYLKDPKKALSELDTSSQKLIRTFHDQQAKKRT